MLTLRPSYYSPTLFRALRISDVALYTGIYGVCRSTAAIAFYAYIVSFVHVLSSDQD
jgi:hypothetical protein